MDDDENDSDDSECSQEESLSNFSKTDDNEPELFGNFGTVDGEAIANDLRGLDEHVDEPFHLADGQNHDGMAPAAVHEDVLEESSTAHEAYMDAMKWFGFQTACGLAFEEEVKDGDDSEAFVSVSEGDSLDSDAIGKRKKQYKDFNNDMRGIIHIEIGMQLRDVKQFKLALKRFVVHQKFDYRYIKNNNLRVRAKCKKRCGWRIQASFMN